MYISLMLNVSCMGIVLLERTLHFLSCTLQMIRNVRLRGSWLKTGNFEQMCSGGRGS